MAYPASGLTGGRPRILLPIEEQNLRLYLDDNPTAYFDEIQWYLYDEYEKVVSNATLSRVLKELDWTRKKATKKAREANTEARALFKLKQLDMDSNRVVCIDESASNERTGWRKYG